MVELIASTLIIAVGFVGLIDMQVNGLKANHSSYKTMQAVVLGNFMLDSLRANRDEAQAGSYNLSLECDDSVSGPSGLVSNDQNTWLTALKDQLGDNSNTCGAISCSATSCSVTVQWDDTRAGGLMNREITVASRI